jgi:hypothetical protein
MPAKASGLPPRPVHSVVIGAIIWLGAAGALHALAQITLGGLRS